MRAGLDFARPRYRDARWLETIELSCVTARDNVRVQLGLSFATNLDVAHSRVVVHSTGGAASVDLDFSDIQHHLPIGTSRLSAAVLTSGLTMRTIEAHNEHEVEYDSVCGRLHVRLVLKACAAAASGAFSVVTTPDVEPDSFEPDDASAPGRIDQPVMVTGEVRIDDSFYTVACTSNRTHRWESVPDRLDQPEGLDELHFADHLSVMVHAVQDSPNWPAVRHAYVVRKGELRRVTTASVVYDGSSRAPVRYEITDEIGEVHRISATVAATSMADWGQNRHAEIRSLDAVWNEYSGHGQSLWVSDLRDLQRKGRSARRAAARDEARGGARSQDRSET